VILDNEACGQEESGAGSSRQGRPGRSAQAGVGVEHDRPGMSVEISK
jgi:hypothetical protein